MPRKEDDEDVRPSRRSGAKSSKEQGWGAVVKRQTEIAEAKDEAENAVRDFWLAADESAIVQFMQDEPYCYDAHTVKDKRGKWTTVPCQLATKKHCVLCTEGSKQTWKAAFIVLDYRGTWDSEKKKFKHDKPVIKIWKVGATIANQLKQQMDKRKKDLSELMFEVTRSGEGKSATYNFEPAFDKDDEKMLPMKWKEKFVSAEDLCQPLTEEEIDNLGLVVS